MTEPTSADFAEIVAIPDMLAEIERLRQENGMLKARSQQIAIEVTEAFSDNQRLRALNAEAREALQAAEDAEMFHANCDECEGEGEPEECEQCFPLADKARCMRIAILAKNKTAG
jgi:hypothetical protein